MKNTITIMKEYPLTAALCVIADIAVTSHFTQISMKNDPTAMVYFIALYGTLMAALIFSAGWFHAKSKAERKRAEQLRNRRRNKITAMYSKEFYGITENL